MTWNRLHAHDEDTSLAAVLLAGGIFERVEMRTAVDEVIEHEASQSHVDRQTGPVRPRVPD